jgi:hypothetical protein
LSLAKYDPNTGKKVSEYVDNPYASDTQTLQPSPIYHLGSTMRVSHMRAPTIITPPQMAPVQQETQEEFSMDFLPPPPSLLLPEQQSIIPPTSHSALTLRAFVEVEELPPPPPMEMDLSTFDIPPAARMNIVRKATIAMGAQDFLSRKAALKPAKIVEKEPEVNPNSPWKSIEKIMMNRRPAVAPSSSEEDENEDEWY